MWTRTAGVAVATLLFSAAAPSVQHAGNTSASAPRTRARRHRPAAKQAPPLPCGDYLPFQVLLDREGVSPGAIDGKPGDNFTRAITALQSARNLPITGRADCDAWQALGGDHAAPAIVAYAITDADINGKYVKTIPPRIRQQAELPALDYRSPLEMLAERFHTTPATLAYLNEKIPIQSGREISVPNVQPFDADAKPAADSAAKEFTVQVTKHDSALRVVRPDGSLVFFAPVTTGSAHDPLPVGDWKVTDVEWHPVFHYNPNLFWDAKATDPRTTLKPGPNNPVGVVWIGISKEHYGLHGTPDPATVGHAQSHGCVRLTNWDAARVAALVRPGTTVLFR